MRSFVSPSSLLASSSWPNDWAGLDLTGLRRNKNINDTDVKANPLTIFDWEQYCEFLRVSVTMSYKTILLFSHEISN